MTKLFNCYRPKVIKNKYTGEQVVTRCGSCPACLNARSAQMVQRLDIESSMHPYNWFVTFQYDDFHVNQLVLLRDEDWPHKYPAYINSDTGEVFDLSICQPVTPADIQYCKDTKILLVPSVSDFQKFIKLLRKKIYEIDPNERLRYYSALELGPTTFRPHLHTLFFLNSSSVSQVFDRLLSDCWKHGNIFDPHIVSGSASQYVASYVNCTTNLPAIYRHPQIRPKALFSKQPPIGAFTWSKDYYKQLFDSSSSEIVVKFKNSKKFSYVPFFRFISDKLYPKIVGFDRLNHFDRVLLYERIGRLLQSCQREHREYYVAKFLSSEYWYPYFSLFFTSINGTQYREYNVRSLQRFCYVVSRVYNNAKDFGVSVDFYVTKIENFYETIKKQEFSDYLRMQDEYFKNHPVKDFLAFNTNFCYEVANKMPSMLPSWCRYYLRLYDPEQLSKERVWIDYKSVHSYLELKGLHDKISFDNTKQKKSNDYLMANKDKFNNIISYNKNIENYVKSEII